MTGLPNPKIQATARLEEMYFKALSQPWPSDIDGARACRVLVGVLNIAYQLSTLTVIKGLDTLAEQIGLAKGSVVKDALRELEALGYLKFELGKPYEYASGRKLIEDSGEPSVVTLLSQDVPEGLKPRLLPEMTLDIFNSDQLGSAGWFATARLQFEWDRQLPEKVEISTVRSHKRRDGTRIEETVIESREIVPSYIAVGVGDVVKMTGMKRDRVHDLLPKLAVALGAPKVKTKYHFWYLDDINRSRFTDTKAFAKKQRADERIFAKRNAKEAAEDRPDPVVVKKTEGRPRSETAPLGVGSLIDRMAGGRDGP